MSDSDEDKCVICYDTNILEDLKCCKGVICNKCLHRHIEENTKPLCPFCRRTISKKDYDRKVCEIKSAKLDPKIKIWLEAQAKLTPGLPIREALIIRRYILSMSRGLENPPNFDYLFIGYYRALGDLFSDEDKENELARLMSLSNEYELPFNITNTSSNTRLFPNKNIDMCPPEINFTKSYVTKPMTPRKPSSTKRKPPQLPGITFSTNKSTPRIPSRPVFRKKEKKEKSDYD